MTNTPAYLELYRTGELSARIGALEALMGECRLCPRECGVKRAKGSRGICGAPANLKVSSAFPHFGEEPPLTGVNGSGTIFFAHCNLLCAFCQNFDISHDGAGEEVSSSQLAEIMLALQRRGCHNINFVTPTHYAAGIAAALPEAIEGGLELPLVWNCGGYESTEVIKLLDGIVDIYMPDVKYADEETAQRYSRAPGYFGVVKEVLKEMHRQGGDLEINACGIAVRGLLIRHLVMPGGTAGSGEVMKFIAGELSRDSYVNIMVQYHPCHDADLFPEIDRPITPGEYESAVVAARECGLKRGFF